MSEIERGEYFEQVNRKIDEMNEINDKIVAIFEFIRFHRGRDDEVLEFHLLSAHNYCSKDVISAISKARLQVCRFFLVRDEKGMCQYCLGLFDDILDYVSLNKFIFDIEVLVIQ